MSRQALGFRKVVDKISNRIKGRLVVVNNLLRAQETEHA
jgi:hypothetical protein